MNLSRILVVDDEPQIQQFLRVALSAAGYGQLRAKIEVDPSVPVLIRTEPGVGYRFAEPNS